MQGAMILVLALSLGGVAEKASGSPMFSKRLRVAAVDAGAGTIEVRETPGKAGSYACKVFLRPHFQLDDVATGFRLVTQLAPAGNAA